MAVQRGTHPTADVLKAFASGKLSDTSADAVVTHLDQCHECSQEVARASASRAPVSHVPPELAANQQYEILRELGSGGMGVVYLAKNKLMDRLEVLKVVNKTLLDRPSAVERFLREIRSAAKLSHPNVVAAHHALQQGKLLAFSMEYVEGQDLASLVKSQGPLPVPHACFYVQQAASGLQHAFEKGMVHRDIKPQNLILAKEGKRHIVKVLDFGLAKVMREKSEDTGLTGEGKMLGTPDYIAPEQTLDAARADIRADIYSLGCTLYYLLSGRPPFSASSLTAVLLAHQMQEAKALNLLRPEVPEELAVVVRKLMAKSPAQRYQTPLEVVQALSPFVKKGPSSKAAPEQTSGTRDVKSAVKVAAPVASPPADVWGSLTEGSDASTVSRKSEVIRKPRAATVRERTAQQKWLLCGGIGVGVLLLALVGMWAGGMFGGKVVVKTKDGLLVIEVNEPNPNVLVDGERVTVSWHNGGKNAEIRVNPGTHKVEIQKDGFSVDGKELTFKDGDRVIFTARLLPEEPQKDEAKADAPPLDNPPPPADTKKPDVPRVADPANEDKGFVPLFNGKDLTGWMIDGLERENWSAKNGEIVALGKGFRTNGWLLSDKDYTDFRFHCEFQLTKGSSTAFVFRAAPGERFPHLKIADDPAFSTHKTGSLIWSNKANSFQAPQKTSKLKPTGDWNDLVVEMRGQNLRMEVNGSLVNEVDLRQFWNADQVMPRLKQPSGRLGFQKHTGEVHFRNIEIKELPPVKSEAPPAANPATEEKGFVQLFNGKDTKGWRTDPKQPGAGTWHVEKGILIGSGPAVSHLYTYRRNYKDFHLHAEARINDGGNSGIYFRATSGPVRPANNPMYPQGYEAQINATHRDVRKTGSLIGMVQVSQAPHKPNEWFTMDVIAEGNHIVIKVNDKITADYTDEKRLFTAGHIVLQQMDAATVVEFRKIEIKELK